MKRTQYTLADFPVFADHMNAMLEKIEQGLQKIKVIPQDEFLTSEEWMQRTKMSRWKFLMLVNDGLLEYKKIGRKFYIPAHQVQKYFNGEMVLK